MADIRTGLEGVVVAQSRMSKVVGDVGQLIYAGYDIHDVAEHASFEEVAYLFWYCCLPNQRQLASFRYPHCPVPSHVCSAYRGVGAGAR